MRCMEPDPPKSPMVPRVLLGIGAAAISLQVVMNCTDPSTPSAGRPPAVQTAVKAPVKPPPEPVSEPPQAVAPEGEKPVRGPYEPAPFKGRKDLLAKALKEIAADEDVVNYRWIENLSQLLVELRWDVWALWGPGRKDGLATVICMKLADWGVSTGVAVQVYPGGTDFHKSMGFSRCPDSDPATADRATGRKWWEEDEEDGAAKAK